jgi:hypothetical protein
LIEPSPPATPKLADELVAEIWHRVAVGPVVFSTPLLPQAAANSIATEVANSRARVCLTLASIQSAVQPSIHPRAPGNTRHAARMD